MIATQSLHIAGKRLIVMEEREFERLCRLAGRAVAEDDLPSLPKPDKNGRVPAIEYTRVSIARDIIRERLGLGLTQRELADLAGVRQETLSRIESAKFTPRPRTLDKIARGLKVASQK